MVQSRETQKQMMEVWDKQVTSWASLSKMASEKQHDWSVFVFCYVLGCHHAKHSSSLAAWAANTRCLIVVLHQLCQGSYPQHHRTICIYFISPGSRSLLLRMYKMTRQLPLIHSNPVWAQLLTHKDVGY